MSQKKNKSTQAFDPFGAVMGRNSGGFSPEAVETFSIFIDEGGFSDAEGNDITTEGYFWLDRFYSITRTQVYNNEYEDGLLAFKAAQTGATTMVFLLMMWLCIGQKSFASGFFFPTKEILQSLVRGKFMPLLRSSAKMRSYLGGKRTDNMSEKQIGNSVVRFIYFEGEGAADSVSLNAVFVDEVRNVLNPADIDQAFYRMDGQDVRMKVFTSTAGTPDDRMMRFWKDSDRTEWHSRCADCHCFSKSDLEDEKTYPGKILSNTREIEDFVREKPNDPGHYEYYCKDTGLVLNPANGEYVSHNPGAKIKSSRFHSMLNRITTADRLMAKYLTTTNLREFWCASIGQPRVTSEGAQITLDHIKAARRLGESYYPNESGEGRKLQWEKEPFGKTIICGADVRHNEIHAVFGGADCVTWIEVFQGSGMVDDFSRALNERGVKQAFVDREPQTMVTEALAKRNPRVMLVDAYSGPDRLKMRKAGKVSAVNDSARPDARLLYNKTLAFQHMIEEFKTGKIALPPGDRIQNGFHLPRAKKDFLEFNLSDEFAYHLQNLVFRKEPKYKKGTDGSILPVLGEFNEGYFANAIDPHFIMALLYYRIGLEVNGISALRVFSAKPAEASVESNGFIVPDNRIIKTNHCSDCQHLVNFRDLVTPVTEGVGMCKFFGVSSLATHDACTQPRTFKPRGRNGMVSLGYTSG